MSKPEASETVREEVASEPTSSPTEDATEGTLEDVDWKIGKQELTILLTMSFLCIAVAVWSPNPPNIVDTLLTVFIVA